MCVVGCGVTVLRSVACIIVLIFLFLFVCEKAGTTPQLRRTSYSVLLYSSHDVSRKYCTLTKSKTVRKRNRHRSGWKAALRAAAVLLAARCSLLSMLLAAAALSSCPCFRFSGFALLMLLLAADMMRR